AVLKLSDTFSGGAPRPECQPPQGMFRRWRGLLESLPEISLRWHGICPRSCLRQASAKRLVDAACVARTSNRCGSASARSPCGLAPTLLQPMKGRFATENRRCRERRNFHREAQAHASGHHAGRAIGHASTIPLMRAQLPDADALLTYLRRIDAARWYTNF